uniref:A2M domain-containing protein n=1 Tax=Macrostomum lignano TaxID=282301 RepID=A0A1I8FJ04_9PLAT
AATHLHQLLGVSIPQHPSGCSLPNPSRARPGPSRRPRVSNGRSAGSRRSSRWTALKTDGPRGRNPDLQSAWRLPGSKLPVKRVGTGTPGLYLASPAVTVEVTHAGQPAGGSPFRVAGGAGHRPGQSPRTCSSGVTRCTVNSYPKFRVDASAVESTVNPAESGGAAAALVSGRTGRPVAEVQVRSQARGPVRVRLPAREAGPHRMEVTYAGLPVPGSPFPVEVASGCDPGRVRAHGPGLRSALVGEPAGFTVDFATLPARATWTLAVLGPRPGGAGEVPRQRGRRTWLLQYTPSERRPSMRFSGTIDYTILKSTISQQGEIRRLPIVPARPSPLPAWSPARRQDAPVTAYARSGPARAAGLVRPRSWLGSLVWTPRGRVPDTRPLRVVPGRQAMCAKRPARSRAGARTAGRSVPRPPYEPLCEGPAEVAVTFAGAANPGQPVPAWPSVRAAEPGAVGGNRAGVGPRRAPAGARLLKCGTRARRRPGELRWPSPDPDGRAVPVNTEVLPGQRRRWRGDTRRRWRHCVLLTRHNLTGACSPFAGPALEGYGDADKVRLLVPPQATVVADTRPPSWWTPGGAPATVASPARMHHLQRIRAGHRSGGERGRDGQPVLYAPDSRHAGHRDPLWRAADSRRRAAKQMVIEEDEIVEKQKIDQQRASSTDWPVWPRYPEIDLVPHIWTPLDQRQGGLAPIDCFMIRRLQSGAVSPTRSETPPDADGRVAASSIGPSEHELARVLMDGEPVAGSPFKFYVDCLGPRSRDKAYVPACCVRADRREPANFHR